MSHVTFVTSNDIKFTNAQHLSEKLGFSLDRSVLDFQEIQADSETIARHKAEQAYAALQKPVIITDDNWSIPGLKGFPGPYMKQMNDWFSPEDWLRLTKELEDRRIILQQNAVYQDENGQQFFIDEIMGTLLHDIRGSHLKFGFLTITSLDGGKHSRAETWSDGKPLLAEHEDTVWHQLASWLNT